MLIHAIKIIFKYLILVSILVLLLNYIPDNAIVITDQAIIIIIIIGTFIILDYMCMTTGESSVSKKQHKIQNNKCGCADTNSTTCGCKGQCGTDDCSCDDNCNCSCKTREQFDNNTMRIILTDNGAPASLKSDITNAVNMVTAAHAANTANNTVNTATTANPAAATNTSNTVNTANTSNKTAKRTQPATDNNLSNPVRPVKTYNTVAEPDDTNNDSDEHDEMKYDQIGAQMHQPLGTYDNTFTNDFDHGYTILNTDKWSVPMQQPPVCITEQKCPVCPSVTNGRMTDLKEWYSSKPKQDISIPYAQNILNGSGSNRKK
jgi:hypothetical protein